MIRIRIRFSEVKKTLNDVGTFSLEIKIESSVFLQKGNCLARTIEFESGVVLTRVCVSA